MVKVITGVDKVGLHNISSANSMETTLVINKRVALVCWFLPCGLELFMYSYCMYFSISWILDAVTHR